MSGAWYRAACVELKVGISEQGYRLTVWVVLPGGHSARVYQREGVQWRATVAVDSGRVVVLMKKRKIVSIVGLLVSSHLLATLLAVEVEIGVRLDHRPPSVGIRSAGVWEEYKIRARLWLMTTTIEEKARGPRLLQALTGHAFELMKHMAESDEWLEDPENGKLLLEEMGKPSFFGKEELEITLGGIAEAVLHEVED